MAVRDVQIAAQEFPRLRPAADVQKVDELNEKPRLSTAGPRHRLDKLAQARNEAVMTDAQKRPGRNFPYPRRLDHQAAGLALGEALVPREDVIGDDAVVGSAPRHHGRHPGAVFKLQAAHPYGTEKQRARRLPARRPGAGTCGVADTLGRSPHV